jgi:hypothetical protein
MEKAFTYGRMGDGIRDSISDQRNMALACTCGLMEDSIMGCGRMVNNMEKAQV